MVHPAVLGSVDLDYAGKRVVVIGSGATAVTLVPAMADTAAPRDDAAALADLYRVSRPGEDAIANELRRWLPPSGWPTALRAGQEHRCIGRCSSPLARRRPDGVRAAG